jgi:hypothetical protein
VYDRAELNFVYQEDGKLSLIQILLFDWVTKDERFPGIVAHENNLKYQEAYSRHEVQDWILRETVEHPKTKRPMLDPLAFDLRRLNSADSHIPVYRLIIHHRSKFYHIQVKQFDVSYTLFDIESDQRREIENMKGLKIGDIRRQLIKGWR